MPLEVDFLFLDPNQSQFFSVKSLLNGLLDGLSYNSSDLANIVCDQVSIDYFSEDSIGDFMWPKICKK